MKIKSTKFFKPYKKVEGKEKCNFSFLQGHFGVYLIKKEGSDKISYIGYSNSDLYKTMYRHFQSWNDKTQFRAVYKKDTHEVRVMLCKTKKEVERLEKYLIQKLKPIDNKVTYSTEPPQKLETEVTLTSAEILARNIANGEPF